MTQPRGPPQIGAFGPATPEGGDTKVLTEVSESSPMVTTAKMQDGYRIKLPETLS